MLLFIFSNCCRGHQPRRASTCSFVRGIRRLQICRFRNRQGRSRRKKRKKKRCVVNNVKRRSRCIGHRSATTLGRKLTAYFPNLVWQQTIFSKGIKQIILKMTFSAPHPIPQSKKCKNVKNHAGNFSNQIF